jgi:hypothetical protein
MQPAEHPDTPRFKLAGRPFIFDGDDIARRFFKDKAEAPSVDDPVVIIVGKGPIQGLPTEVVS